MRQGHRAGTLGILCQISALSLPLEQDYRVLSGQARAHSQPRPLLSRWHSPPATCVNTGTAIPQRGQSPAAWEAGLFLEPVPLAAHSLAFILSWFLRLCPNMLVGPGDPGHTVPHYSPRNV